MNIVVVSDTHIANYNRYSKTNPETGYNSRLLEGLSIFTRIREYCIENKINTVLHCGDLFDNASKISPDILDLLIDELSEFRNNDIDFICLAGQHDYHALDGQINGVRPLKDYLIPIWENKIINKNGCNFVFYPHRKNVELQKKLFDSVGCMKSERNVFVGHFLLKEILEKDGVNYKIDCVSYDDLPIGFDYYFLGDYHKHIWLGKEKVMSVGIPLQHNWRDKETTCGFVDFNLDTGKYKYIENIDSPEFVEVRKVGDFPEGYPILNFYRIFVKSKQEEDKIRAQIDDSWFVDFIYEEQEIKREVSPNERIEDIKFTMHPKDVVMEYGKHLVIDQILLKNGLKYIGEK